MVQGDFEGAGAHWLGWERTGGRRGQEIMGHGSGYWAASEGPYSGTSPKDGPEGAEGRGWWEAQVQGWALGIRTSGYRGWCSSWGRAPGAQGCWGFREAHHVFRWVGFREWFEGLGRTGTLEAWGGCESLKGSQVSQGSEDGALAPGVPRGKRGLCVRGGRGFRGP